MLCGTPGATPLAAALPFHPFSVLHVMLLQNLAAGKALYAYDASRAARFGVLPKSAGDGGATRWFELPGAMFAFHVANAWQEGDTLRLFLCAWQGGVRAP